MTSCDAGTQKMMFLTRASQCMTKSWNGSPFGFDVFIYHEKISECHALFSILCMGAHRAE